MNTRISASLGFASGILVTALYFQLAHTSPQPPQIKPDCPIQSEVQCDEKEAPAPQAAVLSHDILPPPHFRENTPPTFATNREGETRITWKSVSGAKAYRVFLEDDKGKVVKTYSTNRTAIYLKDIPLPEGTHEGTLKLNMASINADDKTGAKGETRDLHVLRQSAVVAPLVKKISIED